MDKTFAEMLCTLFEKVRDDYAQEAACRSYQARLDVMQEEFEGMLLPMDYSYFAEDYIPLCREAKQEGMRWAYCRGFADGIRLLKRLCVF